MIRRALAFCVIACALTGSVARADELMYQNKRRKGAGRDREGRLSA